jgi:hypothetical protein
MVAHSLYDSIFPARLIYAFIGGHFRGCMLGIVPFLAYRGSLVGMTKTYRELAVQKTIQLTPGSLVFLLKNISGLFH